jgi:transposase
LDPYADIILVWLKEHSDLSAAQIEDWLLEEYPDLQVGSNTVRSYIKPLRDQHAIPKLKNIRQYEAIPEVEMGSQIRVDWGQTK